MTIWLINVLSVAAAFALNWHHGVWWAVGAAVLVWLNGCMLQSQLAFETT
jgi:hypothetical protein